MTSANTKPEEVPTVHYGKGRDTEWHTATRAKLGAANCWPTASPEPSTRTASIRGSGSQRSRVNTPIGRSRGCWTLIRFDSPPPGTMASLSQYLKIQTFIPGPSSEWIQTKSTKLKQPIHQKTLRVQLAWIHSSLVRIANNHYRKKLHWSKLIEELNL